MPALPDPPSLPGFHRGVVAHSRDAIFSHDIHGRVCTWNPAAEQLFGWSADEMLGTAVAALLARDAAGRSACLGHWSAAEQGLSAGPLALQMRHRDGHGLDVEIVSSALFERQGGDAALAGLASTVRDISERIHAEQTIWLQAHHDTLTQLPNRRRLLDELETATRRARLLGGQVALLAVDLDRFKTVNENLGAAAGDTLLIEAAARISACLRPGDLVARSGGNEFCVLMALDRAELEPGAAFDAAFDAACDAAVAAMAAAVARALQAPVQLRRDSAQLTCSIGTARGPRDGGQALELCAQVELALQQAKRSGRNRVLAFDLALQQASSRRSRLMADLPPAIERGQLYLVYQPVFDIDGSRIRKCEALLRWQHPLHGDVSPEEFIPIAEDSGAVAAIGDWVFRQAARQLAIWHRTDPALQMTVNVSGLQLRAGDGRIGCWPAWLQTLGLPAHSMVAEITESVMVERSLATEDSLLALRRAGIEIAVDDFGIGFSCLASLDRLDVNCLKIDASFTRKLAPGARVVALCQAITAMAHALGLQVVVEGVETPAQLALLRAIGVDLLQGFLLSHPLRAEAFSACLRARAATPG